MVDFAGPKQIRARGSVRSGRLPPGGGGGRGAFPALAARRTRAPARLPPRRPQSAGPGIAPAAASPLPIPRRDAEQPPAVSARTVRAVFGSARGLEIRRNDAPSRSTHSAGVRRTRIALVVPIRDLGDVVRVHRPVAAPASESGTPPRPAKHPAQAPPSPRPAPPPARSPAGGASGLRALDCSTPIGSSPRQSRGKTCHFRRPLLCHFRRPPTRGATPGNPPAVSARTARAPLLRPGDSKRERMREPHQAPNREALRRPMGGADAKLRPG